MSKFRVRMIALSVFVGVVISVIGMILSGATAKAQVWSWVHVDVFWSGTPCIAAIVPEGGFQVGCGNAYTWENNGPVGSLLGVDPVMGDADWIMCEVYINGKLVATDFSSAGYGTDVNCMGNTFVKELYA